MTTITEKLEFDGHSGARLAARLDLPNGPVRAYALFAHCFTCSKDIEAARRIGADLAREGVAVLRFDFTGLGASEGEFASTNFSTNLADLLCAVEFLRAHYEAPSVLIGHSLGGAAVLALAGTLAEVRAVITIGAPADAAHVLGKLGGSLDAISRDGSADVTLAGRSFRIDRQFVEDVQEHSLLDAVKVMRKPLLIMHAPLDEVVGIDNATKIFLAARHPKSFVSLDKSDHLLTDPADTAFAASVIAGWLSRYIVPDEPQGSEAMEHVRVMETGEGRFQNAVQAGRHRLFADEPESVGGLDTGPSPYDFLSIALGACTAMTLRMYADRKGLAVGRISVDVSHAKVHMEDCIDCSDELKGKGRIDRFSRVISVEGEISDEIRDKLVDIAGKCPVHRTLERSSQVQTRIAEQ
ncbi:bifunctional alpha/beta hydrolase/OsmC family protein [Nitratireductor indicus]|uniref:bifunctional alpha/beta hydrolase/OsmC family protein n=1 Tax=Nitratireductor indicus TaxID=721133 RepID=UPI0028771883|nr:bifunctional alpha/beta hydrolase/OsmC family protein [Nitratireductor indicus]MDS1134632.1 bifunctional alpha/beta hydrolase/OsmC family protein [Nitratireductor indicus]